MRLDTLASTTNDILRLRNPTQADLMRVLTAASSELRMLAEDDEFFSHVQRASVSRETDEVRRTFDELARFEQFLEQEGPVLVAAGVDPNAAAVLLRQASELRQKARATRLDAQELRAGIRRLSEEAGCVADELERAKDRTKQREVAHDTLGRVFKAIGGATMVVADTWASATLGPFAAVSIILGTDMMRDVTERKDAHE
ncbi:MAG TPA: hypothetical protein VGR62_12420 [Candidatus Binatia bacterium]|jgi:hypothetical protein|nr:hypothetical protein [Candidatus Binatia bacterium]